MVTDGSQTHRPPRPDSRGGSAKRNHGSQDKGFGKFGGRSASAGPSVADGQRQDENRVSLNAPNSSGILNTAKRLFSRSVAPRPNAFTDLVERTVDSLAPADADTAVGDVSRILADIKKQYDDIHCEAERREVELARVRELLRSVKDPGGPNDTDRLAEFVEARPEDTREGLNKKIVEVIADNDECEENKRVYEHMLTRLKKESKVMHQKVKMMEEHLSRKTREVEKKQDMSRRVHKEKVQGIIGLEEMENELEHERLVCSMAVDGLHNALQQRKNEVRRREDFERWRYEVAMEAASEAFHASAGRLRKIYAIEKLSGNCLQKVIFEQVEKSQATEDGFQRIREVTGLTDVMDIVHKFLNRDVELEQLRTSVREAEVRLHNLREAENNRYKDGMGNLPTASPEQHTKGLRSEVATQDDFLSTLTKDRDESQQKLRQSTLLIEYMKRWGGNIGKSIASFEETPPMQSTQDIVPWFETLLDTVDRFLTSASMQMPAAKLAKLTSQAGSRERTERARLLTDKDFMKANIRVPATLDTLRPDSSGRQKHGVAEVDREDVPSREALKQEAVSCINKKSQQRAAANADALRRQGQSRGAREDPTVSRTSR